MGKDDGSHTGSETVAEAVDKLEDSHTVDRTLKPLDSSDKPPDTTRQQGQGTAPAQSEKPKP